MASVAQLKKEIAQLEGTIANPKTADSTKTLLSSSLAKMKKKLQEIESEKRQSEPNPSPKREGEKKLHEPKPTSGNKYKIKTEPEVKTNESVLKAEKDILEMESVLNNPNTAPKTKEILTSAIAKAKGELAKLSDVASSHKEKGKSTAKTKTDKYKKPVTKEMKSIIEKYQGTGVNIDRDAERKAKPFGKRTSRNGKRYYEYRFNRADVNPQRYPKLELGGPIPELIDYDGLDSQEIIRVDPLDITLLGFMQTIPGSKDVTPEGEKSFVFFAIPANKYNNFIPKWEKNYGQYLETNGKAAHAYESGGEISDDQLFEKLKLNGVSQEDFNNILPERKAEIKKELFGNDVISTNKEYENKVSDDILRSHLLANNWPEVEIEEALANPTKREEIEVNYLADLEEEPDSPQINEKEEHKVSDDLLINHLVDGGLPEDEAIELVSEPNERPLIEEAYLADIEQPGDEDAIIEPIPEHENKTINYNILPEHYGSGRNIEIFGYMTRHFDVCGKAVLEFERVINEINNDDSDVKVKMKMKESCKYAAMFADAIFGTEKESIDNGFVYQFVFNKTIDNVKMLGIHSYLTSKKLNTSWIGLHVYEIALRIHPENIPSNIDPIAQEINGGEKFELGGLSSFNFKNFFLKDFILYVEKSNSGVSTDIEVIDIQEGHKRDYSKKRADFRRNKNLLNKTMNTLNKKTPSIKFQISSKKIRIVVKPPGK